jgi:hypothetical protein
VGRARSSWSFPRRCRASPKGWTGGDIDERAFTVYVGDDEVASPGEITFGGELQRLAPRAAIAKLRDGSTGTDPTPVRTYDLGAFTAYGFDTPVSGTQARFPTGLHSGVRTDVFRVLTFRGVKGKTVLATIIVARKDFAAFAVPAMRIVRSAQVR